MTIFQKKTQQVQFVKQLSKAKVWIFMPLAHRPIEIILMIQMKFLANWSMVSDFTTYVSTFLKFCVQLSIAQV